MMDRMTQPSPPPVRATGSRSPFVKLRELIDPFPPGMPAISLAVGEPQHPIPSFVGPVLAKHVAEFGRYPANKGLDEFGKAVADWVGRRFTLERPLDAANEVLVLNGTREGLFLAALAAKNWVKPRQGPPAILIPKSVLCRLCRRRDRRQLRTGLSADHTRDRLSAGPRCTER